MTALDTNNVTAITTLVNGGSTGLDTRKSKFNTYLQGRLNNCKIKK
jgi:predicted chitinase